MITHKKELFVLLALLLAACTPSAPHAKATPQITRIVVTSAPAEVPVDVPIYPGAQAAEFTWASDLAQYFAVPEGDLDLVVDFYAEQLPAMGWTVVQKALKQVPSTGTSMMVNRDGIILSVGMFTYEGQELFSLVAWHQYQG